jgi:hypothetical protein
MTTSPSFIVTNIDDAPCVVDFEPWGTEYSLAPGDFVRVVSDDLLSGNLEVSYHPGRISIAFASETNLALSNRAGDVIDL